MVGGGLLYRLHMIINLCDLRITLLDHIGVMTQFHSLQLIGRETNMHQKYKGQCHCGSIAFLINCPDPVDIWKCNCSICAISEYKHLFIKHADFALIQGSQLLTPYQFGSRSAKHLFCSLCGIKSFYQPKSHPNSYSVNLNCLSNPPTVKTVTYFDGKNFDESLAKLINFD